MTHRDVVDDEPASSDGGELLVWRSGLNERLARVRDECASHSSNDLYDVQLGIRIGRCSVSYHEPRAEHLEGEPGDQEPFERSEPRGEKGCADADEDTRSARPGGDVGRGLGGFLRVSAMF